MAEKYNSEKHNRRSIRLKGYNYAQSGAYFVTICTQNRECLFGEIRECDMVLNDAGEMVKKIWNDLSNKCPGIAIDECIIMPNHVHAIICIVGAPLVGALALDMRQGIKQNRVDTGKDRADTGKNRAGTRPAPTVTVLGNIVGIFKSITTHQYVINVYERKWPRFSHKLWQRNYYERIIRNETEMNRIRQYIIGNPAEWENDENNYNHHR